MSHSVSQFAACFTEGTAVCRGPTLTVLQSAFVLQYVRVSQDYCNLPLFHTECTTVCTCFTSVLQSALVSHQVYCSLMFQIHNGCTAVCPFFTSVLQSVFHTFSHLCRSLPLFHTECTAGPVLHWVYRKLYAFHTQCTAVCPYVTLSVLQFYRAYLMVLSVLQSLRVSHRLHCTVYAFQTV